MSATDALAWAAEAGAADVSGAPPLPEAAADLLRRLDFPIPPVAGASDRPAVPATGLPSEAA